jgi:amino acid adenylation domain-containing protein
MLPSAFVVLDSLPITPNGKVDRRALPAPNYSALVDDDYQGPQSPTEERLAEIWSGVLQIDRIGIHDNFFALGGHSLLATQVVSRVRAGFNVELPVRALFEAPTIAELAVRLLNNTASDADREAITPQQRPERIPLSFAQQRLWFFDQWAPGNAAYNIPENLRLNGELRIDVLHACLNAVVRRHETLRTTFAAVQGEPVQVIAPTLSIDLPVIDLRSEPAVEREARARHVATKERHTPFDLTRGPLIRATLLRLADTDHILLVTMHHIVTDGWSSGIFSQELTTLYAACLDGQSSPLPALPLQYADFAIWQRGWLQKSVLEEHLAYWRHQLRGSLPVLQLPTDRPRPAVQTMRGGSHTVLIPADLSERLSGFGQQGGSTLYMVLLTAYANLLLRYTGQEDLIIGSPTAGRNRTELETMIGFFVNTLALRIDLRGNPSARDLLGRVRETCLAAYAHQDLPFEKLVEELRPERDPSRPPIFQTLFVLQNAPMSPIALRDLTIQSFEVPNNVVPFDLLMAITPTDDGLLTTFEYNADLFDDTTIERFATHFQRTLETIVDQPNGRVLDLPILTGQEQHQMLVTWNDNASDYPHDRCIHELVEVCAARDSSAPAVVAGAQELTFGELNERANQVAHSLMALGVGPEVRVGICVERSPEMVVGLLGILKAGGAYVPLDPGAPAERLAFMLSDAQVHILLTQAPLVERLPQAGIHLLCLDTDWPAIATSARTNPQSGVTPQHLAYVIYTSGSTGRPKGVEIQHGSMVNRIFWHQRAFSIMPADRASQFFSPAFDVCGWELWPHLCMGASVHIVDDETRVDPHRFLKWVVSHDIAICNLPTSYIDPILDYPWQPTTALRSVRVGGEKLLRRPERELPFGLVNNYGPTENTVTSTWSLVAPGDPSDPLPHIGRPLGNTDVYVLNPRLQPSPIGVPGELYVGGDGLGRGYLRRPELTAERFIPHPFSATPGARLYRTGDLVRYLPDGNLEFVGRVDHQIKIRGLRIELGEIESILGQHPGLREAVVLAREDRPGDRRLVAYIVPEAEVAPSSEELRAFLGAYLPDYMVPAIYITLSALPLTTNDKVDRQALPAPDPRLLDRSQAFVAPRTPLEATIAGVWSEVLGGIAVSVDDNFFALGGHSLLATQVIARLRAALGIEVQVRTLFEAPTVAQLAEYASTAQVMTADLSPITPQPRTEHLALSFAQERLWFLDQFETNSSVYIIAEAFRLTGHLNAAALERALNALVARHEGLRTTFVAESAQPVQVIHPVLYLTLPVVDLSDLAPTERAAEVATRIAEEGRRPFDLSQGPLLRATLLRLSESEHVLLFTMHHIITDGWSMSILYQEWGTLYAVEVAHRSPSLPGLPIQYADYAAWQRAWLQGSVLEEQLAYWRQHLAGPLPILQLPTDRPRPAAQTFNGAALTRTLRPALRDALVALSEREEVTPFMTLFAAFVVLLARSSGQNDVVVGSPIANRRRAEIEGLIGFFVNTLALRVDLRGNPSVRELLGRVRETCLGAYAHQDLPFEKLVEELRPERDPSRAPIFQTLFVLQNAQSVALDLAGLTVQTLDPGREVVGFDLEVYLWDEPDGLRTEINYNTDLFDQATIVRLLDRYEYLLEHFTTGVDRSVAALPLLPPAERQLLLQDWNATALEYPREALLHELISAQAARTPTAIAVTMDEQQMTYRELEELSTNLAQHLLALGVGPDVRVGVYLDRAPILLPILVGILKAGGAYVPLDPAHPRDRLVYIQEDARIKVLITDSVLGSDFPATDFHIFCIDQVDLRQPAGSMPMPATTPANLAYILYTSGSTGRPKGVQVTHSSLINLLWGMREPLEANADDKVVAVTTLSFDIAGMDLYLPLLVGATIILVPRAIAVDGLRLRALIEETDATLMSATPATWRMLLEANWPGSDRLRIACSGEAIPPELARALRPRCAVLWNLYGPTETTIWSTAEQVESFEPPMPIGRPIANTTIYLLDQYLQPVPLGSVGELYIGGDGLARGYWQRPDLTAERFIPDQFSPMPGMRLYRTGDLARYRADGIIEYLGRADHQVKVRGYRIELGEIEAVLEQHTAVRAAVVTPHEQRQGDVRLVAYLIAAAEPVPATQLQQHARTLLPDYMVPASFVWLESFPLTPSGKVDRRALLPPSEQDHPTATFVAPRDAVEEQLVAIWQEVLDVRPIGIHDDFFALGGHSLLAVRLITRIREQFDRQLPLSVLFSSSTVEQLATLMRGPITRQSGTTIVAIQPLGSRRPFYCVHPAGGSVFCYATLSRYVGLDQPFYGIQAPDLSHTPETTIEELAARYVADLLCMQPEGPYQIGGWSVGGVIAFAMAQHLVAQGHEVSRLIILDAWAPNTSNSPVGGTPPDDTTLLTWFIEDLCALAGRESTPDVAFLSATSTSEALRLVLEQCLIADVLPKDIAVDDLYRHLAVFRCTSTAMARYLPQRYPGQIHLLRAGNNEAAEHNDPTMGWYDLAGAGLVTRTIAGTHYTILSEPQVRDVSTQLVDWLEEEQTS